MSGDVATIYCAGAVRDGVGVDVRPGAVAVDATGRIVAVGQVDAVRATVGPGAACVDLPDRLLIPGLVNAHAHLDLTEIGPQAYCGDFLEWVRMVIAQRREPGFNPIRAVQRGVEISRRAGVLTVGDIAGTLEAMDALRLSEMRGVSFIELLGFSGAAAAYLAQVARALEEDGREDFCVGLQPHAPYSTGPATYMQAIQLGRKHDAPLCTHLAETSEETQFVADADGPIRTFLEQVGIDPAEFEAHYRDGLHPVDWLTADPGTLVVHCNQVGPEQVVTIAERQWSVAYCPRASAYFEHRGHRYRQMIDAGINVCLGTDSIVCHGTLSILDEMRYLYQRDRTPAELLLKMATVNGMVGLRLRREAATFTAGERPGVVALNYDSSQAVDPLEQVLAASAPPQIDVMVDTQGNRMTKEIA